MGPRHVSQPDRHAAGSQCEARRIDRRRQIARSAARLDLRGVTSASGANNKYASQCAGASPSRRGRSMVRCRLIGAAHRDRRA
jgi:hypothetical protein